MGMDVSGINNPEATFRASCWSWRPIQIIMDYLNDTHNFGLDTSGFGYNDGSGVSDHRICEIMADIIEEEFIEEMLSGEDNDTLYLNLGSWVDPTGSLFHSETAKKIEVPREQRLTTTGFVTPEGDVVFSAHYIEREHLREFCDFLRVCGGFEIW